MRRVLHGDVSTAARALLAATPGSRAALVARLLREAEAADRFRDASGRAHPIWGNGSLMSAAMAYPRAREPYLDDREYAACLVMVLEGLIARAEV
jgi:hypothetical protein